MACASLYGIDSEQLNPDFEVILSFANPHVDHQGVIVIHGMAGCPSQFKAFAQTLQDHHFWVCVLRLPGHNNRQEAVFSKRDLINFCAQINCNFKTIFSDFQPHIVGLSLGASVARAVYDHNADSLKSCLLLAPFVDPKSAVNAYLLRTLRALDTITPNQIGTAITRYLGDVNFGRYAQFPGVDRVPAWCVYEAWKFAQDQHAIPPNLGAKIDVFFAFEDMVVNNDAMRKRYPKSVGFRGYPHMMVDPNRVDVSQKGRLETAVVDCFNGKKRHSNVYKHVRTANRSGRNSWIILCLLGATIAVLKKRQ